MDFLSSEQIWGIVIFFAGAGILSWCSNWERSQDAWRKDPKNKYRKSRRKVDFAIPTTIRGTLMTISGSLLSLAGITIFFLYVL